MLPAFRDQAAQALSKKHRQHALWYLDRLVKAEPEQAFAWLERGRLHAFEGHWKQAAQDMSRGVELDPSDHWNWYQATVLQLYAGDLAGYRRLCQGMLERFGNSNQIVFGERTAKACLLIPNAIADRERVTKIAERVINRASNHVALPWIQLAKGMAQYRDGRFVSAADWLQKSPKFINVYRSLPAQSFLALAYHQFGRSDQARKALASAHRLRDQLPNPGEESFPANGFHDWIMGQLAYREAASVLDAPQRKEAEEAVRKHQWQAAVEHLTHLIDKDPDFWPDRVSRSCAYAELGRQTEAKADFARALELAGKPLHAWPDGKSPHPWLQRAWFHTDLGRRDQAVADFVQALELMPIGGWWWTERTAVCDALLSSPPIFAKVLELRPQDPDLWIARARSNLRGEEWDKAQHDFHKAIELTKSRHWLRLERGTCLARLGRWKEAAAEQSKGLEFVPADPWLRYQAAMVHLMAGENETYHKVCARMFKRFGKTDNQQIAQRILYTLVQAPQAVADMEPVLRLAETHVVLTPAYGAALYRAGKLEEAVRELEPMSRQATGFGQAWEQLFLAMAHARLGHAAEARQLLDKAQKWIDEAERNQKLYQNWAQRLEFQVLRREAEQTVAAVRMNP